MAPNSLVAVTTAPAQSLSLHWQLLRGRECMCAEEHIRKGQQSSFHCRAKYQVSDFANKRVSKAPVKGKQLLANIDAKPSSSLGHRFFLQNWSWCS
jgi:hypothetical protein